MNDSPKQKHKRNLSNGLTPKQVSKLPIYNKSFQSFYKYTMRKRAKQVLNNSFLYVIPNLFRNLATGEVSPWFYWVSGVVIAWRWLDSEQFEKFELVNSFNFSKFSEWQLKIFVFVFWNCLTTAEWRSPLQSADNGLNILVCYLQQRNSFGSII